MKTTYAEQYRQICLKIAYYRRLRGLTQEELAERIDRSPAYVGHIEAPNIIKAVSPFWRYRLTSFCSLRNLDRSAFIISGNMDNQCPR